MLMQADFGKSRDEMRAARAATEAAESAPRLAPTEEVAVICGSLRGTFITVRVLVRDERSGREMPPGEFEKLAGKGASKKWKVRCVCSWNASAGIQSGQYGWVVDSESQYGSIWVTWVNMGQYGSTDTCRYESIDRLVHALSCNNHEARRACHFTLCSGPIVKQMALSRLQIPLRRMPMTAGLLLCAQGCMQAPGLDACPKLLTCPAL